MSDIAKQIVAASVAGEGSKVKDLVAQSIQAKAQDLLQSMKPQVAQTFMNQDDEPVSSDDESEE